MSNCILLISDDLRRSRRVAEDLGRRFCVRPVGLSDLTGPSAPSGGDAVLFLVDVALAEREQVKALKAYLAAQRGGRPAVFIIEGARRLDVTQANALGASAVVSAPFRPQQLEDVLELQIMGLVEGLWAEAPEDTRSALVGIHALNDSLCAAVAQGRPLPKQQVVSCSDRIIDTLQSNPLAVWLQAVRQHHSYTYRHSMIVSGLAVSFALRLGMRRADVERLAIGAVLHDLGKTRIPLGILDKPAALSPREREEVNRHPAYGAEILRHDGAFDAEVVDITLHHHEYLDGTGYPDGLTADQISDPVRITTIVDIYASLIDCRPYKAPMSRREAFSTMRAMRGQLDMDILRAFEQSSAEPVPITAATPAPRALAS